VVRKDPAEKVCSNDEQATAKAPAVADWTKLVIVAFRAYVFCGKSKSGGCHWSQPQSAVNDGFSI
jgi:hypothetical protein